MVKPKALIFYTYLPPWRIDVFNEMGKIYELTIIFLDAGSSGFTYNRELLLEKLHVNCVFWDKGFRVGSKSFRFGIFSLVKKYNPEIVFSHEYSPTSILLATYLKFKLFSYKLVITTSDNRQMAVAVKGLKKYFRSYILNESKRLVVYSDFVKEWYKEAFNNIQIEVCPNIQNPDSILKLRYKFPKIEKNYREEFKLYGKVILYVGRLEHIKGVDLLIRAFSLTLKDWYHLVLVGDGSQKQEFKKLSDFYGVSDKVVIPGYFDEVNLYAWYHLADFFVLPSRYEPFGAVVNEALILGCPVLASKHIGALDYIENKRNGFIFDPEEIDDFTRALLFASKNFIRKSDNYRENLMSNSFSEYIKAFERIVL